MTEAASVATVCPSVPTPDEELLAAWRGGDASAGTVLFRRFFEGCRRFFANKVPERDLEDLVQQTFTGMVEGRDRFRGEGSFRAYVFSIARRVLMRYLRDFARKHSKEVTDFSASSVAAIGITPGTAIALEETQTAVRDALQRLPVHYQTILELSYWEDLSTEELAAVFDVETTTVRTRLFRARKALAEALVGTGVDPSESLDAVVASLGRTV